jgi:hypothetical protein
MGSLEGMRHAPAAVLLTLLLAAAPAAAKGGGSSSSLLSGYGGPGDGEQALLGQQLYAPAGSRGAVRGASRSGTPAAPGPTAIYAAPAPTQAPAPAPSATVPRPAVKAHPRRGHRTHDTTARPAAPNRAAAVPAPPRAAPRIVVAPTSAPSPLAGSVLALGGALIALLLALALAARRLAVLSAAGRRPIPPQPTA